MLYEWNEIDGEIKTAPSPISDYDLMWTFVRQYRTPAGPVSEFHSDRGHISLQIETTDGQSAHFAFMECPDYAAHYSELDDEPEPEEPVRYLSAEGRTEDDFGVPFTMEAGEVVYDACTMNGAWATMTQAIYYLYARPGGLGTGKGQKYVRQSNGQLHKVEG